MEIEVLSWNRTCDSCKSKELEQYPRRGLWMFTEKNRDLMQKRGFLSFIGVAKSSNLSRSQVSYLPGHSSQYDSWQHTKEYQAFWNEAEVSDAPGGHNLVQTASTGLLGPPGFLTLSQLGVEAPHRDQQNDVADGPEKAKQAEAWDNQIPLL